MRVCSRCGAMVEDGIMICPSCRTPLSGNEQVVIDESRDTRRHFLEKATGIQFPVVAREMDFPDKGWL